MLEQIENKRASYPFHILKGEVKMGKPNVYYVQNRYLRRIFLYYLFQNGSGRRLKKWSDESGVAYSMLWRFMYCHSKELGFSKVVKLVTAMDWPDKVVWDTISLLQKVGPVFEYEDIDSIIDEEMKKRGMLLRAEKRKYMGIDEQEIKI